MSNARIRRCSAAFAATILIAGVTAGTAIVAGARPAFSSTRLAGANRYDTARTVAGTITGTVSSVVIARGDAFPDALAGSYVAGHRGAPILLTFTNRLPDETKAALDAIKPSTAIVLGGVNAVSEAVRTELAARNITVQRLSGGDRYETARVVAESSGPGGVGTFEGKKAAILASGENFPDALAAGPAAYAAKLPLLLTPRAALGAPARAALNTLGVKQVLLLGGTAAVDTAVEAQLAGEGIGVTRIGGGNRMETATRLADEVLLGKLGFSKSHLNLARGDDFADALTGGPHAGAERAPIVLTQDVATLGAPTDVFVRAHASTLDTGHVFGGVAAVADATQAAFDAAARSASDDFVQVALARATVRAGESVTGTVTASSARTIQSVAVSGCGLTNQTVALTGSGFTLTIPPGQASGGCSLAFTTTFAGGQGSEVDSVALTITTAAPGVAVYTITPTASSTPVVGTTLTYTATSLGTAPVDIWLFACDNVVTASDGTAAFANSTAPGSTTGNTAQQGPSGGSTITGANGIPSVSPSSQLNNVTPTAGSVAFNVAGPAAGRVGACVLPVVFSRADGNDVLELNAANQSATSYGVGGRAGFVAAPAPTGPIGGGSNGIDVHSVDKATRTFVGCEITTQGNGIVEGVNEARCFTYTWKTTDTLTVSSPDASPTAGEPAFTAGISIRDDVTGTNDGPAPSVMNLVDEAPRAPTTASATPSSNTVTITFPESIVSSVASYNVYRTLSTPTCPSLTTPTAQGSYVKAGSVADVNPNVASAATHSFLDTGLFFNAGYCYAVTAVDETGQESRVATLAANPGGFTAPVTTGNTASVQGAPSINDVRAFDARPEGPSPNGLVDGGDVHQLIFNEPMAQTSTSGSYRLRDADGTEADVSCAASANCVLQPAGSYNGTPYPAGRVLRVRVVRVPDATVTGTVPGVQYPATIIAVTDMSDAGENLPVSLTLSTDNVIDTPGNPFITPAPSSTTPTISSFSGQQSTKRITVTFNVPVACDGTAAAAAQFRYTPLGGTSLTPTAIGCAGTTVVTLTFDILSAGPGTFTYTRSPVRPRRIFSLDGVELQDSSTPGGVAPN